MDNLELSISTFESTVSTLSEDDPNRPVMLWRWGSELAIRYRQLGNRDDLDAAIHNIEEAFLAVVQHDPFRVLPPIVFTYGGMLFLRHKDFGNMEDLLAAISKSEEAIQITPEDSPFLAGMLSDLGSMLSSRYKWTGDTDDLKAATLKYEQAVSITPQANDNYAGLLSNLSDNLGSQYRRTRKTSDLDAGISHLEKAVHLTDGGDPNFGLRLRSLGNLLSLRYAHTRNVDVLDTAISHIRTAIPLTTEDHIQRLGGFVLLGSLLSTRYKHLRELNNLEEAISITTQAISSTPQEYPELAEWKESLGRLLMDRYEQTGNVDDIRAALENFEEGSHCLTSKPLQRVKSAVLALVMLQSMKEWERACQVAQEAVRLLPLVCGRYLNRKDQQHAIRQVSGFAALACSAFLKMGNVSQALQQVEFGRGLMLGYLIEGQSDLSVLRQDHPTLADEFETLRFKLSKTPSIEEPSLQQQTVEERTGALLRLEDCQRRIRQMPGYERFLLEPTLNELLEGASDGPVVVVNITDTTSDAIVVSQSGLRSIPLPKMTTSKAPFLAQSRYSRMDEDDEDQDRDIQSETATATRYSTEFLSLLWVNCVKPILDELSGEFSGSTETPRIWWIGTGLASSLPFHAAGDHSLHTKDNTLSQTISSYTPTIKALIHARSCAAISAGNRNDKVSILVVAMPETPGKSPLPAVERETSAIQQAIGDVFKVTCSVQPTVREAMREIGQSDIVHFACHGSSDRTDPLSSHLLLQNESGTSVEELTLQHICEVQSTGKAKLAYLSACSTAEVKAVRLIDEALHIVTAFQVAGFGHVIGSLWSADDETSAEVAKLFYQNLVRGGSGSVTSRAVAEALRTAIKQVKDGRDPSVWASYVHFGA